MDGFIKSDYKLEDLECFRDEKGFIDLSKADIKITSESREKKGTQERLKNWVDFDGKKVLIRGEVVDNYSVYAELIVEEIAKELGIETAHYDLIKIKDEGGKESYGVLSESIIDLDKQQLISLHDLIGDESESVNTTEDVDYESVTRYQFTKDKLRDRLSLSGYSEQDINQILLDYDKRMLFYLSVLDTDKHTENISFVKDINGDGKISLSPNYDSEFSLLLELDRETAEIIAGQPFGIEEEAEVQDPKIGVIVGKEDGGWINGGYMVLEPQVIDYIDGDMTTFEREPLERLSQEGQLQAYKYDGFWQCMDTLRDKMQLEEMLEQDKAPWKVWDK